MRVSTVFRRAAERVYEVDGYHALGAVTKLVDRSARVKAWKQISVEELGSFQLHERSLRYLFEAHYARDQETR